MVDNQMMSEEYWKAVEEEIRKSMEKTDGNFMRIPVNTMNLSIPQEMVERWHQDLRTIIRLHEENSGLKQTLAAVENRERNFKDYHKAQIASLEASLKTMAEKVSSHQSSLPQQEGESKRNRELNEALECTQQALNQATKERDEARGDRTRLLTERDNLERINSNIKSTLTQCQNNLTVRNEELHKAQLTCSDLLNQRAGLQNEVSRLSQALETERMGGNQAVEDLEEVKKDRCRLQNMTEGMTVALNCLQEENRRLTEALKDRGADPLLKQQLDRCHTRYMNLECQRDSLHRTIDQMKKEAFTMGQQAMGMQQKIQEKDQIIALQKKENERLSDEVTRLVKEKSVLHNNLADSNRSNGEYEACLTELNNKIHDLGNEVTRLKEGRFTEDEFQALCHKFPKMAGCRFHEEDCQRFCKGCLNYWVNLFGKDKLTPVLVSAAKDVISKAQVRWVHRDHAQLLIQDATSADEAFAEDVVASLFELYCYNSEPVKCVKQGEVCTLKVEPHLFF